jgi:hypothetical protein
MYGRGRCGSNEEYWQQFTQHDPKLLPTLAAACGEMADQLHSYGLDVEYTKYMILSAGPVPDRILIAGQAVAGMRFVTPTQVKGHSDDGKRPVPIMWTVQNRELVYGMKPELIDDEVSLTSGARRMQEAADLFRRHMETLLAALDHGGRSSAGTGDLATTMDQVNEALAQACRHLHTNLCETSTGIQTMAARMPITEDGNAALISGLGLDVHADGPGPADTRRREGGQGGGPYDVGDEAATA